MRNKENKFKVLEREVRIKSNASIPHCVNKYLLAATLMSDELMEL